MRICLVRPLHQAPLAQPPLALGYLSAALQQAGHQVRVLDGLNLGLDNQQLASRCARADLVGISTLSDYLFETVSLVERLKLQGLPVVVGGPHASLAPARTLEQTGADYVVVGEGEAAMLELVGALSEGGRAQGIPGVATLEQPDVTPHDPVGELDALPFPDWDQCAPATYPRGDRGVARKHPVAPVVTTRGCKDACSFCSVPFLWQNCVRHRSPDNVVDEIEYMMRRHGVREIRFEDENLTSRRTHIESICATLLSRGLQVSWSTPNGIRADTVDRDLLDLMRESGCHSVTFGIESASPEILRRCGKGTSINRIEQTIAVAHEAGLSTEGCFVFGLPGETEETIQHTIDFARRSKLDRARFLLLDVMPGSPLWRVHREDVPALASYRSFCQVTWCPEDLPPEKLRSAPARARRAFLSSPTRLLRLAARTPPAALGDVLRRLTERRFVAARG